MVHAETETLTREAEARPPTFARWLSTTNSVTQQFLAAPGPDVINLGGGLPAPEFYPLAAIETAVQRIIGTFGADALSYGPVEGLAVLREAIAHRMSGACRFTADNILVTTGAMQALDLVGKLFIDPDSAIVVQHPTYLGALDAWRPRQPRYRRLDWRSSPEGFSALLREARFAYAVPDFSNPTGELVDGEHRLTLVAATRRAGVPLIEDDPYSALLYDGSRPPRMIDLAAGGADGPYRGHVIHIGTLSKILAPGLRIGWIAAAPDVIRMLSVTKQGSDLTTSALAQAAACEILRDGIEDSFLPTVRAAYRERRDALCAAADEHIAAEFSWQVPPGGMFLWARARQGAIDTDRLHADAVAAGLIYAPSSAFDATGADRTAMRLNFTLNPPDRLREAMRRLGSAARRHLAGL